MAIIEQGSQLWQLEGSSAEAYERYLVPMMFAPWAEKLVERAAVQQGERVLDVACGTGIVARYAATRVGARGTVVGMDLNESMLETARAASGPRLGVEWWKANASEMPFEAASFDVVFCQQALQFFNDRLAALREMRRVLSPRGRLAISVWRPLRYNPSYTLFAEALERHAGEQTGEIVRSPFPEWDLEEFRALIHEAGFEDVHIRIDVGTMRYPSAAEFLRREAASSPLAEPLAALPESKRTALIGDLVARLQPYTDDEGVVFPMETYIAIARLASS